MTIKLDLACPNCGSTKDIFVEGFVVFRFEDGVGRVTCDPYLDGGKFWCDACDYTGNVGYFEKDSPDEP